jgi:hypothetical protein
MGGYYHYDRSGDDDDSYDDDADDDGSHDEEDNEYAATVDALVPDCDGQYAWRGVVPPPHERMDCVRL